MMSTRRTLRRSVAAPTHGWQPTHSRPAMARTYKKVQIEAGVLVISVLRRCVCFCLNHDLHDSGIEGLDF